jgi:hypothetical protein
MNLKRIPREIIHYHIIPYTYQLQKNVLLNDIKTYVNTYDQLQDYYSYDFNDVILMHDLIYFYTYDISNSVIINDSNDNNVNSLLYAKFKRLYALSNKTNEELNTFVWRYFSTSHNLTTTISKIRFLWGILTPLERNMFISEYLVNEYEYGVIHV